MEGWVVQLLTFQNLEEVAHHGGAYAWKRFAHDGYDSARPFVVVAQLNQRRKYAVCLAGTCPALTDDNLLRTVLDVVICRRLPQLTVESSDTNHDNGFFSATSIS